MCSWLVGFLSKLLGVPLKHRAAPLLPEIAWQLKEQAAGGGGMDQAYIWAQHFPLDSWISIYLKT